MLQPKLKLIAGLITINLISEAISLTKALPLSKLIGSTIVKIEKLSPKEFFGKGKVEEIASILKSNKIQLVIINGQISPIQQQNLEKKWSVKILDRTALILEIFLIERLQRGCFTS